MANLDADNDRIACESLPAYRRDYAKPGPGSSQSLQVTGRGGVPTSGVSAVALNVTATQSTAAGYVQVIPTGGSTAIGSSSNLNVTAAGQTIANLVIVPVGDGGRVTLYSSSGTHLLADVAGYFTDSTAASSTTGLFQALEPDRVLDTRDTASKPADESTTALNVLSQKGVPASGVSGVVLNITAGGTTGAGYVQVFPTGRGTPVSSSNVNIMRAGQVIANSALATLGEAGSISLYASRSTHLVADVFGYYLAEGAPAATPTASPTATPSPGGQQALQGLRIAPHNTTVAYNRDAGVHWIDADGDCQNSAPKC